MIVLVTAIERRDECAAALREATGEPVVVAENLARATTLLRTEPCTAAVFDQHLAEAEPHETDTTVQHLGTALPVEINLAISSTERVVREVQAAPRRRKQEEVTAREAAARALYCEVNDTLTTLLLDCERALLETPNPVPVATERLSSSHKTAQKLRMQLETGAAARAQSAFVLRAQDCSGS
jgi:hypothetical protein